MTGQTHAPFFFTDASLIERPVLRFEGADARHLKQVRRAKPGDLVRISDGVGHLFSVKLTSLTERDGEGEIIEEHSIDRPLPSFGILQGLAKGGKVDFVIQKLVEVGVDQIAVFSSGRSVPDWDEQRKAKALRRWQSIGREAAKQSQRPWLPIVTGPIGLNEAVDLASGYELGLVLAVQGEETLKALLPKDPPQSVIAVVGPEGGLTQDELAAFRDSKARAVRFGDNILRTETAAIALVAALMYHFDRF